MRWTFNKKKELKGCLNLRSPLLILSSKFSEMVFCPHCDTTHCYGNRSADIWAAMIAENFSWNLETFYSRTFRTGRHSCTKTRTKLLFLGAFWTFKVCCCFFFYNLLPICLMFIAWNICGNLILKTWTCCLTRSLKITCVYTLG